jgi:OOP family OmpA-OmpF porin
MKILIPGFAVFVIWCVFSAWAYNDKLLPVLRAPEPVPAIPEKTTAADSLARIYAAMPEKLSVYFEFNDSKFENDQQTDSRIAEFKEWIDKHPGSMLWVTGHTDLIGTELYNQDLGMKRAEVVSKYILSKGIPAERMLVESKGESQPAGDYLTSEGRAKNRRTEISIKTE